MFAVAKLHYIQVDVLVAKVGKYEATNQPLVFRHLNR
jgi:hypothetical protein